MNIRRFIEGSLKVLVHLVGLGNSASRLDSAQACRRMFCVLQYLYFADIRSQFCHRSLESAPRAVTSKCTTAEVGMNRVRMG